MEIEEYLNEFMKIAYNSIEEKIYYPTVVNDIHNILKAYNTALKKRKIILKLCKFMARLMNDPFQIEFQEKNNELINQEIFILNYLIYKFNILIDSNNDEDIRNYFILFENFMRFSYNFDNFVEINNNYDRSCLADYMLQNNDEYLNNIKEAVKVFAKKDDKLCLNIR